MARATAGSKNHCHNIKTVLALALIAIAIVSLIGIMSADDTYADSPIIVDGDFEYKYYNGSDSEVELSYYGGSDKTVIIPSTIEHNGKTLTVVAIGSYALGMDAQHYTTTLSIPDTVRTLGPNAFGHMNILLELWIPISLDASSGTPFARCNTLIDINFTAGTEEGHNYDEHSIKNTPWYQSRNSLKEVDFKHGIRSIGDYTLYDGNFNNWNLNNILTIPHGVETIGDYAFAKCNQISKISLPSTLTKIGTATFRGCDSLSEFIVSNGNAYSSINGMLYNRDATELIACPAKIDLAEFYVPTSVRTVADYAFYNCTNLTTVDLSGVEEIGDRLFDGCTALTKVHFGLKLAYVGEDVFGDLPVYNVSKIAPLECTSENLRGHVFDKYWSVDENREIVVKQSPPKVKYILDGVTLFCDTYLIGEVVTVRGDYAITGYTVTAWTNRGLFPVTDGKFVMGDHDVKFYATSTINQYTITLMNGSEVYFSVTLDYNSALVAPIDPSKIGYTFMGWTSPIPLTMPAEDLVLYAVWDINQYTITFDSKGGNDIASITADYGSPITAPNDPIKEGHLFLGWFLDGAWYVFNTMPATDLILHAEWSPRQHTISFTVLDEPIEGYPIIMDYGSVISMPSIIPIIRNEIVLYEFNQWIGFTEGITVTQDMTFPASFTKIYVGVAEEGNDYYLDDTDVNSMIIREEILRKIIEDLEEHPRATVHINLEDGSIMLDYDAISKLDDSITDLISLQMKGWDELPDTISSMVDEGRPVYKVGVGGITEFDNGTLTIRLDYQLKKGESADNLKIWHFKSDGTMVEEKCTYNAEGGYVEFTTNNLSHFAIMHIEPEPYVEIGTAAGVLLTVIVALALVAIRRQ